MTRTKNLRSLLLLSLALTGCDGASAMPADGGLSPDGGSPDGGGEPVLAHYEEAAGSATWVDACAMGTDLMPSNTDENTVSVDVGGFDFRFFGEPITMLRVSTNGWLSFSQFLTDSAPRHDQGPANLPSEGAPNAAVYALWEDLRVDATNGLCAARIGSGASETLVVQWNARFTQAGGDLGQLAFQVQLEEGSHDVEILWNTIDASGDAATRLASATIGIENEGRVGLGHPGTEAEVVESDPASGTSVRFVPSP
jgi:hypothetical protein